MTELSVTLSSPEVLLERAPATVTASVTNAGAEPERLVLGVFRSAGAASEADPSWATVDRPLREVGPGATEQYAVTVSAPEVAEGTYELKLIAYPADAAPEEYAQRGQVLRVVVPQAPPPAPSRRRWWPYVLGAVLLLVVVGVVVVILARGGDRLPGESPSPDDPTGEPTAVPTEDTGDPGGGFETFVPVPPGGTVTLDPDDLRLPPPDVPRLPVPEPPPGFERP